MKKYFIAIGAVCLVMLNLYACADSKHAESVLIDLPNSNHQVELSIHKSDNVSAKLLLFLHGSSGDGLKAISQDWLNHWLGKGYTVAAISMPGYGKSTGKKDFCGPLTIEALHYAIDTIKEELELDDFGVIGFGQGGLAALLLASQRDDIRCLVISNSGYDISRHKLPDDSLLKTLDEKGYDLDIESDEALKLRSPILVVKAINAPTFLLHRQGNPVIQEQEIADFHAAMLQEGKECYLRIREKTPDRDAQKISQEEILEETEDWIDFLMR